MGRLLRRSPLRTCSARRGLTLIHDKPGLRIWAGLQALLR
jgi:hypothetical protein